MRKLTQQFLIRQKESFRMFFLAGLLFITGNLFSQDPNFYIFLCFGQSNMEGNGTIEAPDTIVDSRFQVLEAIDCSNLGRTKGSWYTAVPPLCRCSTGLSPADYFGKTMIANLPDSITVGVVNVSVAGCQIELFDKNNYPAYAATAPEWMVDIINEYDGNPYARLVEMGNLALNDGVIKGILLHQGESNVNDSEWITKVKNIYDTLLADLGLGADSVPLLAGEVVDAEQGGACAAINVEINKLPDSIPTAYVISSSGLPDKGDNLHFTPKSYREFGVRYAVQMLSLLGHDTVNFQDPRPVEVPIDSQKIKMVYFEPECAPIGEDWNILADASASNGAYVMVRPDTESVAAAPADSAGAVYFTFTADTTSTYYLYGRFNCPSANDDSYWIKMDDGTFEMANGLGTSGWQWLKVNSYDLTVGEHTLAIAYRENGAKLDKICLTNFDIIPTDKGDTAVNICDPGFPETGIKSYDSPQGFGLGQNYPNPFTGKTMISFQIPDNSVVSLKVYNILGTEIAELAGKLYSKGSHTVEFNAGNYSNGVYLYILRAGDLSASRSMVIEKR